MIAREPSPAERYEIARFGIHAPEILASLDFEPEGEK
jgi:hypothetical protein